MNRKLIARKEGMIHDRVYNLTEVGKLPHGKLCFDCTETNMFLTRL